VLRLHVAGAVVVAVEATGAVATAIRFLDGVHRFVVALDICLFNRLVGAVGFCAGVAGNLWVVLAMNVASYHMSA
jgi:hypothetical protein